MRSMHLTAFISCLLTKFYYDDLLWLSSETCWRLVYNFVSGIGQLPQEATPSRHAATLYATQHVNTLRTAAYYD